MKRLLIFLLLCILAPAQAGIHDDVGYTRLKKQLGDTLPTGAGISIGQVESSLSIDHDSDETTLGVNSWVPDPDAAGLRDIIIVNDGRAPDGVYSGHATAVARRLAGTGRNQGMVSAIDQLRVFLAGAYLGSGLLQTRRSVAPLPSALRIINHSWAGNGRNSEILRRTDWLTDTDEVIQVVGVRNAKDKTNSAYMAAAANAIVVGRSDGNHSIGTPAVDDVYVAGRARPHLVAPLKTGSAAAPTVASAVALLLDLAANPDLSNNQRPLINRGGLRIYDAGRSEVMRAILMAGASRTTDNSSSENLAGYRDIAANRTGNGLDRRYGAGQLNVYNAWEILTAGEQEYDLRPCGFDYEPALGAGEARDYDLPAFPAGGQLAATLSWNLVFSPPPPGGIDLSAKLNRLQLALIEITAEGEQVKVMSSSAADTTQSVYEALDPAGTYRLRVAWGDGVSGAQDYALAWHVIINEAPRAGS